MADREKLIKEIMADAEKDGEPVTREEAEEMADMELGAKEIRHYETSDKPKEKKKREVKPDEKKVNFIEQVFYWVRDFGNATNVTITNPQREVSFTLDGESYSLTLVKHRPPKNKGN